MDAQEDYTRRERALLAGAVRYFIDNDDIYAELSNPTGFEDDTQILNAVCVYLARRDLTTTIE